MLETRAVLTAGLAPQSSDKRKYEGVRAYPSPMGRGIIREAVLGSWRKCNLEGGRDGGC